MSNNKNIIKMSDYFFKIFSKYFIKKLLKINPLLLTALGIVSAATYAAPELTVTSIGQEIEIENEDHNGTDLDDVWLYNTVGLAYKDWSFAVTGGKQWDVNFDDHEAGFSHGATDKGVKSGDSRLQIDVWKKVTDDLKLGFRYRGYKDKDRYYARWNYNHGMFWSEGDLWYESTDTGADWFKSEFFPVGLKYGAFKVGYFVNYNKTVGTDSEGQNNEYFEHQIRAYATLYKGERLTLTTEGRFTISADNEYEGKPVTTITAGTGAGTYDGYRHYDDFGRIRLYLGADYKVTENLNVYGKYGYEFREWALEDNAGANGYKDDYTNDAYQNVILGWKYTF